jgi:hypothetical protein
MGKRFSVIVMLIVLCLSALVLEQRHGILVGVVVKLDSAANTVVVKLADGTEHTLHFVKRTTVYGAQNIAAGAKDTFQGLKAGSDVAVHYTAIGTEETAEEIDNIGKNPSTSCASGNNGWFVAISSAKIAYQNPKGDFWR